MSWIISERFMTPNNPKGLEPVPDFMLINDGTRPEITIESNATYLLRFVNMAAFASIYVWIENITMQVVEVDGIYTVPASTSMIYMTPGQRTSVLITTIENPTGHSRIVAEMDEVFE